MKGVEDILEDLTPCDVRVLVHSEEELSQCDTFERIFPTTETGPLEPAAVGEAPRLPWLALRAAARSASILAFSAFSAALDSLRMISYLDVRWKIAREIANKDELVHEIVPTIIRWKIARICYLIRMISS